MYIISNPLFLIIFLFLKKNSSNMSVVNEEVKVLFELLNSIIERTKKINNNVQKDWQSQFYTGYIRDIETTFADISFFQIKYNVIERLKIDTDSYFKKIGEKIQIKEERFEQYEEPSFVQKVMYAITFDSKSAVYILTQNVGEFVSDPREEFTDLNNKVLAIFYHYFQKYSYSELDVAELNFLQIVKFRFLKNWKRVFWSVVILLVYSIGVAFLGGWISTYF